MKRKTKSFIAAIGLMIAGASMAEAFDMADSGLLPMRYHKVSSAEQLAYMAGFIDAVGYSVDHGGFGQTFVDCTFGQRSRRDNVLPFAGAASEEILDRDYLDGASYSVVEAAIHRLTEECESGDIVKRYWEE